MDPTVGSANRLTVRDLVRGDARRAPRAVALSVRGRPRGARSWIPGAAVDLPLPWLLANDGAMRVKGITDAVWTRLLDVPAALGQAALRHGGPAHVHRDQPHTPRVARRTGPSPSRAGPTGRPSPRGGDARPERRRHRAVRGVARWRPRLDPGGGRSRRRRAPAGALAAGRPLFGERPAALPVHLVLSPRVRRCREGPGGGHQPVVAPRIIGEGTDGPREAIDHQLVDVVAEGAEPSSTTRRASGEHRAVPRFATKPHAVSVSRTTIGRLPQPVATAHTVSSGLGRRLEHAHDLGEAHHRRGRRPVPADDRLRAGSSRPRARRSGSPTCSRRGSWRAASPRRARGTRPPSARGAPGRPR